MTSQRAYVTETERDRRLSTHGEEDLITMLKVLPDGPVFDLEAMAHTRGGQRMFGIGKSSGSSIKIEKDRKVSYQHCLLYFEDGWCRVEDNESKNGTYVSGRRLGDEPQILSAGDVIWLGRRTRLLVCGQARERQLPRLSIFASLADFVRGVLEIMGSFRATARLLGRDRRTLQRWSEE